MRSRMMLNGLLAMRAWFRGGREMPMPSEAPVFRSHAGWINAPFGQSKRTVAGNARAQKKRNARRRARRLGHA